jgi:peroxiredoxin Q/BCP
MTEANQLNAGDVAPVFELQDQDGKPFNLEALRGQKVILYFYPAASTPGCTKEACDFNDNLPSLAAAGYTIVGVSPDKVAKLKKFQEAENLHFTLLSDEDIAIHKLYGAFGEKSLYGKLYKGVLRSTIVIDEAGVITLALYKVKATGHVAMLRKKLGLDA